MRIPPESTFFELKPTPYVSEQAGVLWVPESRLTGSSTITRGTTLAAFAPVIGLDKGNARLRQYGSYTLTESQEGAGGLIGFWFNKPKTAEEAATAIRSYADVEPSLYWPPVLTRLDYYQTADGTWTFYPKYKDSYDGPTKVLIEEFFAPDPFDITTPVAMRPQEFDDVLRVGGLSYDYSYGRLSLKRCLHGAYSLVLGVPSTTINAVTYSSAYLVVPSTNYTDWPSTLVIDERQKPVSGGYLKRRVTAYRPF